MTDRTPKTRAAVPPAARGSAISDADPAGVPSPPCGAPASPSRQAVSQDTTPDGTRASSRATPRTGPRDGTREEAPKNPAGVLTQREGGTPAGSTGRTFTIALPAGLEMLSLNDRLHWRERHKRGEVIRNAACWAARMAKVPQLPRAGVVIEYQPPDRRHRDADNPIAAAKAAIDGLVIARCLPDDECPRYVTGIYCTIGEIFPRGRLVLRITEVAP